MKLSEAIIKGASMVKGTKHGNGWHSRGQSGKIYACPLATAVIAAVGGVKNFERVNPKLDATVTQTLANAIFPKTLARKDVVTKIKMRHPKTGSLGLGTDVATFVMGLYDRKKWKRVNIAKALARQGC